MKISRSLALYHAPAATRFFGDDEVKETIQAPYKFTDDETRAMERQLRGELGQIDLLETQKKASMKDFGLRIDNRKNTVEQLRHKLDTGEEMRAMEVVVTFEPGRSKKKFFHPVTGDFIREEEMTPADWQLDMFTRQTPAVPPPPKPAAPKVPESGPFEHPQELAGAGDAVGIATGGTGLANLPPGQIPEGGAEEKNQGKTNVGDILDIATVKTQVAQMVIADFSKPDWTIPGLTTAFRAAAKKANWSPAHIKFLAGELKKMDTVEKMKETLAAFVIGGDQPATPTPPVEPSAPPPLPALKLELPELPLKSSFAFGREFRKAAVAAAWPEDSIVEVENKLEACQTPAEKIVVLAPFVAVEQSTGPASPIVPPTAGTTAPPAEEVKFTKPDELEVNCVPVSRIPLALLPQNWAAERIRVEWRKAARKAGWQDREIEHVDYRAQQAAQEIQDEPEAGEAARKILVAYCYNPSKQNADGTAKPDDDDLPM